MWVDRTLHLLFYFSNGIISMDQRVYTPYVRVSENQNQAIGKQHHHFSFILPPSSIFYQAPPVCHKHELEHDFLPLFLTKLPSSQRNGLDLHRNALRKLLDRHTGARRLSGTKVLLIHAVHLGEVLHRRDEDVDLDHTAELETPSKRPKEIQK